MSRLWRDAVWALRTGITSPQMAFDGASRAAAPEGVGQSLTGAQQMIAILGSPGFARADQQPGSING